MFCVELCLQGKKSFSMILFFIISFLDFDKTSTYTPKKIVLHLIYVVSIYSNIHCWKRNSPEYWEGIQALQIISTYFLKSILFFLQCPFFLDGQVHSLKYAQRTLQDFWDCSPQLWSHWYSMSRVMFNEYTGKRHMSSITTMVVNVTCRRTRVLLPP